MKLRMICASAIMLLVIAPAIAQRRAALAYVSNERHGTVSVTNTATDRVVKTIAVGQGPWGIALSN